MGKTDERNTLVDPEHLEKEREEEGSLRPRTLTEYVGQERVKESLAVFIEAARKRGEALDHVLLSGPPGLGKTTLAYIVAREMGVGVKVTSGPVHGAAGRPGRHPHEPPGARRPVHRRDPPPTHVVEEILYPAMEDYHLDILVGPGPSRPAHEAQHAPLHPRGGHDPCGTSHLAAARPLRHELRLEFYNPDELATIVRRSSKSSTSRWMTTGPWRSPGARGGRPGSPTGCSGACGTTPRSRADGIVTRDVAARALEFLEVDRAGLRHHGPKAPAASHRQVQRRPRGNRQPVLVPRRGEEHHRGRLRALPGAGGLHRQDGTGQGGHEGCLRALWQGVGGEPKRTILALLKGTHLGFLVTRRSTTQSTPRSSGCRAPCIWAFLNSLTIGLSATK